MPNKNIRNPENKGLPARWRIRSNAYYYRVPKGLEANWDHKTEFFLGRTLPEAFHAYSNRINQLSTLKTIAQLLDRYAVEVIPTKAKATQTGNYRQIKNLIGVFGHMMINSITPMLVYQYIDKRGAKTEGKREIALLSHAYTKAVQWGYLNTHPFKGQIRLEGSKPRNRQIEDWEIEEAMTQANKMLAAYIPLKILTGLRKADLLSLKMVDLKEDGIHVTPRKTAKSTNKKIIITWTPSLRAAVDISEAARPKITDYLFCSRKGEPYFNEGKGSTSGFDSIWQRFMAKVIANTKVNERFTEHDLRAKATDNIDLEHAQKLLAHSNPATTKKIYMRKPTKVAPSK